MTTTKEGLRRAVAAAIDQLEPGPGAIGTRRSIVIERISPELDGGRYPVKRVVGDPLHHRSTRDRLGPDKSR
jgi:hypothetical protein